MGKILLAWLGATSMTVGFAEAQRLNSTEGAVPFVGCSSDGQVGPQAAPVTENTPVLPSSLARRVAYYAASGTPGVLAPRGWHCFGLYGSSGSKLIVAPRPLASGDLLGNQQFRTDGPAVELAYDYGGTSGRWAVAEAIARYFPLHHNFIEKNFRGLKVGPLPSGPYTHDKLTRRTEKVVRYLTPANTKGAGTEGFLAPTAEPIKGLALLVTDPDGPDLLRVNVRLPDKDRPVVEVILRNAELQASR